MYIYQAMCINFCNLTIPILFFLIFFLFPSANSVHFQIPRFDPEQANVLRQGDAVPSDMGAMELISKVNFLCRVGWATYAESVPLWDSKTGNLADSTTHFSFTINTQGHPRYGHGLVFFLAPVGFQIPPNSAGGFLGLFNTTTVDSSRNQIVLVEFDIFSNPEWDPPVEHVGINKNSLTSAVYTPWNASLHSGDNIDASIAYNAATKNLSVNWKFKTSVELKETTSLSYQIDLKEVLPQWITIGFSAATGRFVARHTLKSSEFNSTVDIK